MYASTMGLFAQTLNLSPSTILLLLGIGLLFINTVHARYFSCLSQFPGPFLASLSDIWRLVHSYRKRHDEPYVALHRKYGDVVRIGPNALSFATPRAMNDIYGAGKNFQKSEFYSVIAPISKGVIRNNIFSTRDEKSHGQYRRTVNPAYTMSSMLRFEPFVDENTEIFLKRLAEMRDDVIDLPRMLQLYAFDTAGMIAYSRRYGFLDEMKDIDGIMKSTRFILDYTAHIGNMPSLDWAMLKNPFMLWLGRIGLIDMTTPLYKWAARFQNERMAEMKDGRKQSSEKDILDAYIRIHEAKPEALDKEGVTELGIMMGFAGSESTSATLSALVYHVLANASIHQRLQTELGSDGSSELTHVSYAHANSLPYLDACVKETFRIHPAGGFVFERLVPAQGASIAGHAVPAGTIVGCSSWPVHRDTPTFGRDVDVYRPERWLEAEPETRSNMAKTLFHFGGSPHECQGKNMSLMEVYKMAATLFRNFEMELACPHEKPQITKSQFVRIDFKVKMRSRKQTSSVA